MSAYLSARESAAYCGVSEKTIRNWIASGRLSAEKSAGAFRIAQDDLDVIRARSPRPPQGQESASADVRAEGGPQGADLAGLVALVDRLTVENRQLAEAAAVWQERARVLSDQLALGAPQSPLEAPGVAQPPDPTTDATVAWWRRWLLAIYG